MYLDDKEVNFLCEEDSDAYFGHRYHDMDYQ